MNASRIASVLSLGLLLGCSGLVGDVSAQTTTSFGLCLTRSTGVIRGATRCKTSEVLLNASNFAAAIGAVPTTPTPAPTATPTNRDNGTGSIDLATCYKTSGQGRGTSARGDLAVGVQCSQSDQVLLSYEFATDDKLVAFPSLLSTKLIYSGAVPNGIEVRVKGTANTFYTLNVTAVCCDRQP